MGPLHCRYIVEEGRRERAGGGGEEKKSKRDAGEPFLFFVCVFWFVEKESTPTYNTWIQGYTYERGALF